MRECCVTTKGILPLHMSNTVKTATVFAGRRPEPLDRLFLRINAGMMMLQDDETVWLVVLFGRRLFRVWQWPDPLPPWTSASADLSG